MNLDTARTTVIAALGRMDSLYNKPVFDEWVLFKLAKEQGVILAYSGPRTDSYQKKFRDDIVPLRAEIAQRKLAVGDFAFVDNAEGTGFDACIRLGPAAYLFCNNIAKSMADLRKDPLWREAQKPFAQVSELFRQDPLE
ncbi:MAG: hypothetical protein PSW75_00445 [bacterium]|nr:hypothetical protein [bacterium]MDI1336617.1 hypothetical protein [Lacunisphaera sp.]